MLPEAEFDINYIYRDEKYKPYLDNIHLMDTIMVDFSSSKIRQLVKEGKSIRYQTLMLSLIILKKISSTMICLV